MAYVRSYITHEDNSPREWGSVEFWQFALEKSRDNGDPEAIKVAERCLAAAVTRELVRDE